MNFFVRIRCRAWIVSLIAIALFRGEVEAQDNVQQTSAIADQDEPNVLVLQDGGVLIGKIARDGERYVLTRAGGEMQVPAAGVMLVAASLDDAYAQRRQRMDRPTAEAHLVLADWCLRHNLIAHAKRELTDARQLDSEHARLVLLDRRLALAIEQPQKQPPAQPAAPQATAVNRPEQSQPIVNDLPNSTVERFTRRVQPILVNNCTTSGCHQAGAAQEFQLDRAILRGLANRRSTMSNLAATLELVDRERPQLSRLLTIPRRAHGGMQEPIFGPRQEQAFRHLVDWIDIVTQSTAAPDDTSDTAENAIASSQPQSQSLHLTSPVLRLPRGSERSGSVVVMSTSDIPQAANSDGDLDVASSITQTRYEEMALDAAGRQPVRYGVELNKWRPRDPFDPEIFNRRYQSRSRSDDSIQAAPPPENR